MRTNLGGAQLELRITRGRGVTLANTTLQDTVVFAVGFPAVARIIAIFPLTVGDECRSLL